MLMKAGCLEEEVLQDSLPGCRLVGSDAVERHGVRCHRLQQSVVALERSVEKERKREERSASGKVKLQATGIGLARLQ
jgi:hypothetical protein